MYKYIVQTNYFIDEEFFIFDDEKKLIKFLKKIKRQYPTCRIQIYKCIEMELNCYYEY